MRTMYQVREFVGSSYSKVLGFKLRNHTNAVKLVNRLKKQGRDVFSSPMKITK